jgi:hypothetical protein
LAVAVCATFHSWHMGTLGGVQPPGPEVTPPPWRSTCRA